MNLLLLNDTYFGPALEEGDVNVLRAGPGEDNDLVIDPDHDDIAVVIERLPFRPDAILLVDSINRRVFFRGLEKINAPRAFYAVDGPINDFWQHDYAYDFDLVFTDQKEIWDRWRKDGIHWSQWLPLAADRTVFYPPDDAIERDLDLVFVGTMDFERRPKRSAILHRLRQVARVTLLDGDGRRALPASEVAASYRRAKIVLNELLFDGVNLRTFEAMACGAVLLTESGRGEQDLFEVRSDLVSFDSGNLETVVRELLANPEQLRKIGDTAATMIRAHHSLNHRARKVLRDLAMLKQRPERDSAANQARAAWGMWMASWKWDYLTGLRHRAAEILVDHFRLLDPARQTILLEGVGQAPQARDFLRQLLDTGAASPSLKPALASLALSLDDEQTAREALDLPDGDRKKLHLTTGERLLAIGQDLTPGFSRFTAPRSSWNAFEHFQFAYSLDEDCREALDGLDRVLQAHHATEFSLPLWQRFHSRNPKHEDVERLLIKRARTGYFLPARTNGSRKDTRIPLTPRPAASRISTAVNSTGTLR